MTTSRKNVQKSVHSLLHESPVLLPVFNTLAQITALNKTFHAAIPPAMHQNCRVTHLDGSTAVIGAATGAMASKIKQLLPQILLHYPQIRTNIAATSATISKNAENKQTDQELTGFRVEVQPAMSSAWPKNPGKPVEPRQEMPQDKLQALSGRLLESPLKTAVDMLIKQREKAARRTKSR